MEGKSKPLYERLGFSSMWDEHSKHALEDWVFFVTNDDTRLGYWEWVEQRIELGDEEEDGEY